MIEDNCLFHYIVLSFDLWSQLQQITGHNEYRNEVSVKSIPVEQRHRVLRNNSFQDNESESLIQDILRNTSSSTTNVIQYARLRKNPQGIHVWHVCHSLL